jgi:hypothetical protein
MVRPSPRYDAPSRMRFHAKESRGSGDPHWRFLDRWGLWSRVLDGGRSSSSFNNDKRGCPRVDRQCELAKRMHREVLKLYARSLWSKDPRSVYAVSMGGELGF